MLTRPHPFIWGILALTLIAAAIFWPARPVPALTVDASTTGDRNAITDDAPDPRNTAQPNPADDLRSVTLRRPLVDPPPRPAPPPPPASPPRHDLRLVAILTDPAGAPVAAFVQDLSADEFRRVNLDQTTGSGAVLIALQSRSATFELAGRRLTLDLPE